jgi:glycosyltransferase involved in cell wall biosynthesis
VVAAARRDDAVTSGGITCLIAAYNEAARIGAVLAAVAGHPLLDRVIVIDDGSGDGTAEVAASVPGVTVLRQDRNRGKTWALSVGIEAAADPLLLLLDADLVGLTPAHLTALIAPVQSGRADVSVSLRGNAPRPWHWLGLDYISGERVVPRDMLAGRTAELRGLPKFGFEVALNRTILDRRARLAVVPWPEVSSPLKSAKHGVWAGIRGDAAMMADIFRTVPPLQAARQITALRRLRIAGRT